MNNNILNAMMSEILKISSVIGAIDERLDRMEKRQDNLEKKQDELAKKQDNLEKKQEDSEKRLQLSIEQLRIEMFALNKQILDKIQKEMEDAAEAHIEFSRRIDDLYVMINK